MTGHPPRALAAVVGITVVVSAFLIAFAWPASEAGPESLPVGAVGPAAALDAMRDETAALEEDAFDITAMGSRAEAVSAIEDRDVYGALVLSPDGAELLTAPAASPAVADLLEQIAQLAAAQSGPVSVTEVVPLPEGDPLGAVFRAGALPLVLGGIVTGAVLSLTMRNRRSAIGTALVTAASTGLALAALLQFWWEALGGSYLANAAVIALGLAAVALTLIGLANLLGLRGVGLGALTMLLLGNPLSGLASAPELLPEPWGTIGQLLPPGATATALRGTAFFDGAGVGTPLVVLGCWALVGLLLAALPRRTAPAAGEPASRPALQPA